MLIGFELFVLAMVALFSFIASVLAGVYFARKNPAAFIFGLIGAAFFLIALSMVYKKGGGRIVGDAGLTALPTGEELHTLGYVPLPKYYAVIIQKQRNQNSELFLYQLPQVPSMVFKKGKHGEYIPLPADQYGRNKEEKVQD